MTTIVDAFADAVAAYGDRPALIDGSGKPISFEGLSALSERLAAHYAARGISAGDRVLLAMPVGVSLYASLAALWRLGAVVVFPEPALGLKGLRHAARVTTPKAFIGEGWYRLLGWFVPELRRLPLCLAPKPEVWTGESQREQVSKAKPNDPALISFTSGSTGAPKAIVRSHGFLMAQHRAIAPMLDPGGDGARDLVAFPVFVLVCLALGVTSVLPHWRLSKPHRVTAQALHAQIKRDRVTRLLVPPTLVETLSGAQTLPKLDAVFTGGGPVFPDALARLASLQPTLQIVAVYGSTEAEPIAHLEFGSVMPEDLNAMRNGGGLLAGRPVDAVDVQLRDGEILVAGDHVNESYLDTAQNHETKVTDGGRVWHRTGDAGRFDEQGRLWLLGRHAARVGEINPFAVETAARFWPGAERSALIGLKGQPVLAISGDARHLGDWQSAAARLGVADVRHVRAIPLDRRHRSKTDYVVLKRLIAGA